MAAPVENKREVLRNSRIVLALFCFLTLLVGYRVVTIGIINGEEYRAKGKELSVKAVDIAAERGNILADNGEMLATSMPLFDIRFDPLASKQYVEEMSKKDKNFMKRKGDIFKNNVDSLSWYISKHLTPNLSPGEVKRWILRKRSNQERYMLIAKDISYQKSNLVKTFPLFNLPRNQSGLIIETKPHRTRPYGDMALRTIGYTRSNAPSIGLEKYYDEDLKGEAGKRLMQYVKPATWIPVNDLTEIEPRNGNDVMTTINVMMQDVAKTALEESLRKHNALNGCAIVMEVKTGAIKAIANLAKEGDSYIEKYNYAIALSQEPGSTFKLASLMAMLEDKKVTLDTEFDAQNGKAIVSGREMKDADWHPHQVITLRKAFEVSSNIAISKAIVQSYAQDRQGSYQFIKRLKQFHLDKMTGIKLEGESKPLIKTPYNLDQLWSKTTLAWMAHGYETQLTPLQMLTFYNAVANHGKMMRPYFVSGILSTGVEEKHFAPEVISESIASERTIKLAQEVLEGVVLNGTARKYKTDQYTFAGKTGTASLDYGGVKKGRYRASFVGYFPADDPQYSVYVMVSEPREQGFHGSEVALPVFRAIADKIMTVDPRFYKVSTPSPEGTAFSAQLPANEKGFMSDFLGIFNGLGVPVFVKGNKEDIVTTVLSPTQMDLEGLPISKQGIPDVRGMGLRDAVYTLESKGLSTEVIGYGKVSEQDISPGTMVSGQKVVIKLQ